MASELIKLFTIIGGGAVILVGGFLFQSWQRKRKAQKALGLSGDIDSGEDKNQENPQIKNYILQYKDSYSKEQIREGLKQSGFNEDSIEEHLRRFT